MLVYTAPKYSTVQNSVMEIDGEVTKGEFAKYKCARAKMIQNHIQIYIQKSEKLKKQSEKRDKSENIAAIERALALYCECKCICTLHQCTLINFSRHTIHVYDLFATETKIASFARA